MINSVIKILEIVFWVSIFFIIYSYSLYPVLLFIFARFFGKPTIKNSEFTPTVGVLVPAYNEEKVIRKKIENILSLNYPQDKISVWVGSDCSNDETENIVRSYSDPRVHLWRSAQRTGKTGVINNLTPLIDAEIILFTDANTMHRKDCLQAVVRNFADVSVGGVAGQITHSKAEHSEEEFGENIYRSFEVWQKILEGNLHSTISAFGGFYAIRKSLFKKIPPNSYSNDDVLIPMNIIKQGYRIIFDADAQSFEDITGNVASEFSRRVRIGAGNYQAFFWLLPFLSPFKGWPAFCFFSHKVTRWFSPVFFLNTILSCSLLFVLGGAEIYKMIFASGAILFIAGFFYKVISLSITRHIYYFFIIILWL